VDFAHEDFTCACAHPLCNLPPYLRLQHWLLCLIALREVTFTSSPFQSMPIGSYLFRDVDKWSPPIGCFENLYRCFQTRQDCRYVQNVPQPSKHWIDFEHHIGLGILAPTDFLGSYWYECGLGKPHSTKGYCAWVRFPLNRQGATLSLFLQLRHWAKPAIDLSPKAPFYPG